MQGSDLSFSCKWCLSLTVPGKLPGTYLVFTQKSPVEDDWTPVKSSAVRFRYLLDVYQATKFTVKRVIAYNPNVAEEYQISINLSTFLKYCQIWILSISVMTVDSLHLLPLSIMIKLMLRLKKLTSGFTVVELLIVIAVIGILATLVLNTVNGTQAKARDSERAHEATLIRKSLEAFDTINGYYPETGAIIGALPELDPDAMTDPDGILINDSGADYIYEADSCSAGRCSEFTLTVSRETDNNIVYTNL